MAPATSIPEHIIGEFTATRANELFQSHKKFLEWRKTEWATRGPEALEKRMAARAASHGSWRQMKGMDLVRHELGTPGTRPFAIGVGVMSVLYLSVFFSQGEGRKNFEYWGKYHAKTMSPGGH